MSTTPQERARHTELAGRHATGAERHFKLAKYAAFTGEDPIPDAKKALWNADKADEHFALSGQTRIGKDHVARADVARRGAQYFFDEMARLDKAAQGVATVEG